MNLREKKRLGDYAVITYNFRGETVREKPHGNSKTTARAYTRTKASVMEEIGNSKLPPREIEQGSFQHAGGLLSVRTPADHIRNTMQIYNVNRNRSSKDDLLWLINRQRDDPQCPVIDIHMTKECQLAVTLATTEQLKYIDEFCCIREDPMILGIDMTYNMGSFYVTPTTFRNPQLIHQRTMVEPTLLGPTLIHSDHGELVYRTFAADLVNARGGLKEIRVLGSDRAMEMFKGFQFLTPNLKHVI